MHRCPWVDLDKEDYVAYHDAEWGVPVHDDQRQFEFLTLESAQAGLSWYTVLRNRLKVKAAVHNARCFLDVQSEFGSFDAYIWRFVDGHPIVNELRIAEEYPATSSASDALSKDLKRRGFKFVGSTIVYAHMQAAGLVNDHAVDCFRRREIIDAY